MYSNVLDFCEHGNIIEVEKCLKQDSCVNVQNTEGITPLQVAAANGFTNLVALLLKHGAFIDFTNNYGWTPLMHACKYGHVSTVSFLLKKKAKVNISNKLGLSALVIAVCNGNLAVVKLLVESGAIINQQQANNCDLSTIMAVSFYGHISILEYLLNNDIDVNFSSAVTGLTPSMLAACGGHKNILSMLVENGSDFTKKDICGRTALDFSRIFNQKEVENYLENLIAFNSISCPKKLNIFEAIINGNSSKVKQILEKFQNSVNSIAQHNKKTPLMQAAILGHIDIVKILLSFGANLDDQDTENGWTALMHAAFNNHKNVVQILLEKGADASICASNGLTVYGIIRQNDNIDPAIIEIFKSKSHDDRNFTLLSPEISRSRERLSAPERLSTKRSSSQTRVKEWIGGVAQQLQNKMHTLRSTKLPDSLPNIDITSTDDSLNEVFLDQATYQQLDTEESNEATMQPPELYLSDLLKEHKVEAVSPPFPSPSLLSMEFPSDFKDVHRKNEKQSKVQFNSLRIPNLLKNHIRKQSTNSKNSDLEKTVTPEKRNIPTDIDLQSISIEYSMNKSQSNVEHKDNMLDSVSSSLKPDAGELTVLLNQESLHKYIDVLRNQEVDMETFQHLTEEDLNEIGIHNDDSQKKLMEIIKKLQKPN